MSTEAHALAADADVSDDDYQEFYAVLTATARGRAFLDEHARRQRHAETEVLLAALQRLESQVAAQSPAAMSGAPALTEVAAVLETVRNARAEIDAVRLGAALAQLVGVLDTVQSRLSALVPGSAGVSTVVAAPDQMESRSVAPPFALALTAVAAQALAAAEPDDEPIKVLKAGSIPPPPPFKGDDFSPAAAAEPAHVADTSRREIETAHDPAPTPDSAEDPFAPIMRLSEEERLALFS